LPENRIFAGGKWLFTCRVWHDEYALLLLTCGYLLSFIQILAFIFHLPTLAGFLQQSNPAAGLFKVADGLTGILRLTEGI
jgi:hypothetical protein